ncbi:hypothetical protein D030_1328A, partial [Vibrio parahaemolyticus AQ3810]
MGAKTSDKLNHFKRFSQVIIC